MRDTKPYAFVNCVSLKGGIEIPSLMVCLDLTCGNCGARNVANVTTRPEAEREASWCPVCEDEQDPQLVMIHHLVLALPGEPA